MAIYLIVDNGVVVNSVLWDGVTEWHPETGVAIESDGVAGIGWRYENGIFINPNQVDTPDPVEEINGKMDALSIAFKNDVLNLNLAYLSALVVDGASEAGKITKIREELAARKQKYKDDINSLIQ